METEGEGRGGRGIVLRLRLRTRRCYGGQEGYGQRGVPCSQPALRSGYSAALSLTALSNIRIVL